MMKKYLNQNRIIAAIFLVMICLIGFISDYKLMKFYVNDEVDYNEWNAELGSKFQTDYNSNLWLMYGYVNFNGVMHRLLGHHEMNSMVKLKNGYLVDSGERTEPVPIENIQKYALYTGEFNRVMKEQGVQYIFVNVPATMDKYNPMLPLGIDDYTHDNLDNMALFMRDQGVDVLDLRDRLHEEGKSSYDYFFKTDRHWTTRGGFWAYNELMDYIEATNSDIHADEKIRDLNNYKIETYSDCLLGHRGQQTGIYYAGIDDFELILPNFPNHIEVWGKTDEGGSVEELMIHRERIKETRPERRYAYSVLGCRGRWHNPDASVKKNITLVSDSMSETLLEYMALTFENVDYVYYTDVRYIDREYMDTFKPDIIVSMTITRNTFNRETYLWQSEEL